MVIQIKNYKIRLMKINNINKKRSKNAYVNLMAVIMIICIGIFLSGCQGTSGDVYKTGTQGLTIGFSSANTKSIYEGENFGLIVTISNAGAANVNTNNPATLKVSYDDYRLTAQNSSNMQGVNPLQTVLFGLHGKSIEYPQGDQQYFTYYFQARPLTKLRETSTTSVNFNLCYPYTTQFTTLTCIDITSVTNDQSPAACTVQTYSGTSGQGAPMVVTKIEPQILLQSDSIRPQFGIYIQNAGTGYVTDADTCQNTDINNKNQANKVKVTAMLSGTPLKCGLTDNTVNIIDGTGFIRCYLDDNSIVRNQRNYQTPLTITLAYTYVTIDKQDIEIKNNPTYEAPSTQGACNSYEIEYNGKCMTKCDYCSGNPTDPQCQVNAPFPGFTFTDQFSCSCDIDQCNAGAGKGNCIKGYCPGDLYCCLSGAQCDQYQVQYNGKCINKCDYCANINSSDGSVCGAQGFNFTGFSCQNITSDQCDNYATSGACIKGYCGGSNSNSYCANLNKQVCPPTGSPEAIILYGGKCLTICQACGATNGALSGYNCDASSTGTDPKTSCVCSGNTPYKFYSTYPTRSPNNPCHSKCDWCFENIAKISLGSSDATDCGACPSWTQTFNGD